MELLVYHTQKFRPETLTFPPLATGNEQWLGEGFYFWQDREFSKWWGEEKKKNLYGKFSMFKAVLEFSEEDFIDTVFNEMDYYNFVNTIERFAKIYSKRFRRKPSLEDFNDFTQDHKIWINIGVIRFQDIPKNDTLIEVSGFYYKKRIQIRVNKPEIITNFEHDTDLLCI